MNNHLNAKPEWQRMAEYAMNRYLFYDILLQQPSTPDSKKFRQERQQHFADVFVEATMGHVDHLLPFKLLNHE